MWSCTYKIVDVTIQEFQKKHKVPDDFDPVFYENKYPKTRDFYQPFCKKNGISDNVRLFYHYFHYGQKSGLFKNEAEMRDVTFRHLEEATKKDFLAKHPKNTSDLGMHLETIPSISIKLERPKRPRGRRLFLYQQWWPMADKFRELQILHCLIKNIENTKIDRLYLFCENGHRPPIKNRKLFFIDIPGGLTFKMWLDFTKQHKAVHVLANSDILFDDSIYYVKTINDWSKIYTVSRLDLRPSGELGLSSGLNTIESHAINPFNSQDCWIVGKHFEGFSPDFRLGVFNCDYRFLLEAAKAQISCVNLKNFINAIHVDNRTKKTRQSYDLPDQQAASALLTKFISIPKRTPRTIFVKPINGLSNRLRVLSSAYRLAQTLDANLKICWSPSPGFSSEPFDQLFETANLERVSFIGDAEYQSERQKNICIDLEVLQDQETFEYDQRHAEPIINEILDRSFCYTGSVEIEAVFPGLFPVLKSEPYEFIRKIQPVKEIEVRITEMLSSLSAPVYGVHIRRGDALESPYAYQYSVSKDALFIEKIREIIRIEPEARFFLATDCAETEKKIRAEFPKSILTNEKKRFVQSSFMRPKENQSDAVVDLFVLARAKKIFGSNWSSFSLVASQIGSNQLEVIAERIDPRVLNDNGKISAITVVKDREAMLKVSLSSWQKFTEIDEFVIVDWSSEKSLTHLENQDPRIRVIRIEGQSTMHLAKALNLAISKAKNSRIIKLDVDYILNPYLNFFNEVKLSEGEFLTGDWRNKKLDSDCGFLEYLNGFIFTFKQYFTSVGGYDEAISSYGWEDSDLYARMTARGLKRKFVCLTKKEGVLIYHNPHPDFFRTKYYGPKDTEASINDNRLSKLKRISLQDKA